MMAKEINVKPIRIKGKFYVKVGSKGSGGVILTRKQYKLGRFRFMDTEIKNKRRKR